MMKRSLLLAASILLLQPAFSQKKAVEYNNGFSVEQTLAETDRLVNEGYIKDADQELEYLRILLTFNHKEDKESLVRWFLLQGKVSLFKGQLSQSKEYFRQALNSLKQNGGAIKSSKILMADALKGLAETGIELCKYGEGGEFADLALESHSNINDIEGRVTDEMLKGAALIGNLETDAGEQQLQRAANLAQQYHIKSQGVLGRIALNYGILWKQRGRYDKALPFMQDGVKKLSQAGLRYKNMYAWALYLMGEVYFLNEQYDQALLFIGDAIKVLNESPYPRKDYLAMFWTKMSDVSKKMFDTQSTQRLYKNASKTAPSNAPLSGILGTDLIKSQTYSIALQCLANAYKPAKEVGPEGKQLMIDVYMGRGKIYFEDGQWENARSNYQSALDLMKNLYPDKHPMVAECLLALGNIALATKDLDNSLQYIGRAVESTLKEGASAPGDAPPNLNDASFPYELLGALTSKGQALREVSFRDNSQTKMDNSLVMLEKALELLNALRKTHRTKGQRYELALTARRLSMQAVETAYSLYQSSGDQKYVLKAFEFAESARASKLLEALRDLEARRVAGIPDEMLEIERSMRVNMANCDEAIFYELKRGPDLDQKQLASLQNQKLKLASEYNAFVDDLEKKYPKYFELKYRFEAIALEKIQSKLGRDEAVVEYLVADGYYYAFAADANNIEITKVKFSEGELSKKIKKWVAAVQKFDFEEFLRLGADIHNIVVAPVPMFAKHKTILVIPDGALCFINFEALTEKAPEAGQAIQYDAIPYLIRKHSFYYNSSATLFGLSFVLADEIEPAKSFCGYAPDFTNYPFDIIRNKLGMHDDTTSLFSPLPEALKEISEIGQALFGDTQKGNMASEENFRKTAEQYGILHLATHATMNNLNPLYSRIIFAADSTAPENDGLLHTYEIFSLDINAVMVTLSTCSSGAGLLEEGEGTMSLARGFSYAGCPNLVMSMWSVPDASTRKIMNAFYQYLLQGMTKSEALRQAKLDYLSSAGQLGAAPLYWGGFVLNGNNTPLDLKKLHLKGGGWAWWQLGLLMVFILGGILGLAKLLSGKI